MLAAEAGNPEAHFAQQSRLLSGWHARSRGALPARMLFLTPVERLYLHSNTVYKSIPAAHAGWQSRAYTTDQIVVDHGVTVKKLDTFHQQASTATSLASTTVSSPLLAPSGLAVGLLPHHLLLPAMPAVATELLPPPGSLPPAVPAVATEPLPLPGPHPPAAAKYAETTSPLSPCDPQHDGLQPATGPASINLCETPPMPLPLQTPLALASAADLQFGTELPHPIPSPAAAAVQQHNSAAVQQYLLYKAEQRQASFGSAAAPRPSKQPLLPPSPNQQCIPACCTSPSAVHSHHQFVDGLARMSYLAQTAIGDRTLVEAAVSNIL